MRAVFFTLALAGLAVATPRPIPQEFDTDALADFVAANADAPQGAPLAASVTQQAPTYVSSVAAASASAAVADGSDADNNKKRTLEVRSACQSQPAGAGPTTSPDNAQAFLANPVYNQTASSANTPTGYTLVFSDLMGASQQGGYLGYYTLPSYTPALCQQKCDAAQGCVAFNMYYERDPTVNPGSSCTNPQSTVNIKCSLYGAPITAVTATNSGQYREQFQVVIAGSNGYVKNLPPPPQANFSGPVEFGGAINAPSGTNTYITYKMYQQYDPSLCAAACQAQTAYDRATAGSSGTYAPCNFFNIYALSTNGAYSATYCSLYTVSYGKQYSTNYGQYQGSNYVSVSDSYGYTLTQQDCGNVNNC